MREILLALAILVLPVHFLVDGFGSLMTAKSAAGQNPVAAMQCTPALDADPACAEDDPLEVSSTGDASDYLAYARVADTARWFVAELLQPQQLFPASFYPPTASPPPRA